MRRAKWRWVGRPIGLAAVLVAATAAVAVAGIFIGDGTFVGTNQNDQFYLGSGNDKAYGLLGADYITAGNGNDVLDGDGQCMRGSNNSNYCTDGPQSGDQGDTIYAGNGNDTVYGGGGHNKISVGTGTDIIWGGPLGDTITTGANGHPTIHLGAGGGNNVTTGTMAGGTIFAQNGKFDTITCKTPNSMTVYADRIDSVTGCKTVIRPAPAVDRRAIAKRSKHRSHKRQQRHH
jgi:Ca2+-binding RTX toxin-like protein